MKTRVLSAIVMTVVLVPILIVGGKLFAAIMMILACGGLYELIHIRETRKKFPLIIKIFAYIMVVFFSLNNFDSVDFLYDVSYKAVALMIFLFLTPIVFINDNKKYNLNDALFLVGSVLFIGLSFSLLIITRNFNIKYIIYLLLITIFTDTFALFTGMMIGSKKLASGISPKKTIEGSIGGSLMGTFVATAFYMTVINPHASLVLIILVTLGLTVVGQLGDLVFSAIKRYYGEKDFSNLIPGHGGILDRLDSLIFVVLAFILIMGII